MERSGFYFKEYIKNFSDDIELSRFQLLGYFTAQEHFKGIDDSFLQAIVEIELDKWRESKSKSEIASDEPQS